MSKDTNTIPYTKPSAYVLAVTAFEYLQQLESRLRIAQWTNALFKYLPGISFLLKKPTLELHSESKQATIVEIRRRLELLLTKNEQLLQEESCQKLEILGHLSDEVGGLLIKAIDSSKVLRQKVLSFYVMPSNRRAEKSLKYAQECQLHSPNKYPAVTLSEDEYAQWTRPSV